MQPTIQSQLQYIDRTSNPNYIVIIRHKANDKMDFSKFIPVIPKSREIYKPKLRYEIVVLDMNGNKLILVKDTYINNRVVFECTCKESKLEKRLEEVSSKYKGRSILDKVCL